MKSKKRRYLFISLTLFLFILSACGASGNYDEMASQEGDSNETINNKSTVEEDAGEEATREGITLDNLEKTNSVDLLDLIPGKLAFDIPKQMKVGDRYDVTFSITQSLNEEILFNGLDSTKFEIRNIDVSSGMRVLIYDPEQGRNFEIHSQSANIQHVTSNKNTTWLWHIKPLKKGSHKIIAKVHATIYTERGTEREINQIVFNEEINVEATPSFTLSNFFKSHWQWLFGTLLIPLFVYLYKKRKVSPNNK